MSIDELILILQRRLAFNASQRETAALRGDLVSIAALDADTASTQATLAVLQTL
jgi:hypothetical protein